MKQLLEKIRTFFAKLFIKKADNKPYYHNNKKTDFKI